MINELYENILKRMDTRENLILLKQEIKEENKKRIFAYLLGGDYTEFGNLLKEKDPKVRKNAALILGEMECEEILPELWEAYEKEIQLFVKPSYLKAISKYDYYHYLPFLKKRLLLLTEEKREEEQIKHIREETTLLQMMISKYEKPDTHSFQGFSDEVEVILLTNREHREITKNQIEKSIKTVLLAGGVKLKTKNVKELWKIRTFHEMLFPVPNLTCLSENPELAAQELAASCILDFLKDCHRGTAPFRFRVDIRGRMVQENKGKFIKRFSARLEEETGRRCLNSVSEYEIEFRLLEKKEGGFLPVVKLYTMRDERFSYRKQVIASSIHPVNAAIVMELIKPWLKEGAQVLDPFCGVGTMLIERAKILPANPIYGIDLYSEAIQKARENTKKAGIRINYINRDILSFQHAYSFDELITNMPSVSKTKSVEEITELYELFLQKMKTMIKQDGMLALYTAEESILTYCLKKCDWLKMEKKWTIREKEGSVLYLLKNCLVKKDKMV